MSHQSNVWYVAGVEHSQAGNICEGVRCFGRALALEPYSVPILTRQYTLLLKLILAEEEDSTHLLHLKGHYTACFESFETLNQAFVTCCETLIAQRADSQRLQYHLGRAYGQLGRVTDAVRAYKRSIDPMRRSYEEPGINLSIGLLYEAQGDAAEALTWLDKASIGYRQLGTENYAQAAQLRVAAKVTR